MSNRTTFLSTIAAAALATLPLGHADAAPAFRVASFNVPAVAGAISESRSLARSAEEVRHQGGFATAAAVQWLARAPRLEAANAPIPVPGVIGAMGESRALARSAEDVRRQGGFATAAAVQWLVRAPSALEVAAY